MRLFRNVHDLWNACLHTVGEFVLRNAGLCFRMPELLGLDGIELAECIQCLATQSAIHAGRIRGKQNRIALRAALNSLEHARQKAATEGTSPAVGLDAAADQDDKGWQIFVLTAKSIRNPRSERWATAAWGTRIDQQFCRRVIELIGVHAMNKAKMVGNTLQMRQAIREHDSRLTRCHELV